MQFSWMNPGLVFACLLFAGLSPLSFLFHSDTAVLLADTPQVYLIWLLLAVAAMLLVYRFDILSARHRKTLSILYICVPFAFRFSGADFHFLILDRHPWMAAAVWGLASILVARSFLHAKHYKAN